MKKYFFLSFLFLFASSCVNSKVEVTQNNGHATENSIEDKALRLMDEFFGSTTKGVGRIPIVHTINVQTKSGDSDVTTSVVNFERNEGFVVLLTDEVTEDDNLVAISNNGNLNSSLIERIIRNGVPPVIEQPDTNSTFIGGEIIGEDDDYEDDVNEPYYDVDPSFSLEVFTPFTIDDRIQSINQTLPDEEFVEYYVGDFLRNEITMMRVNGRELMSGGQSFCSGVKPLIKTKWDQSSPYNNDCPVKSNKVCPAGCVAIAIGQLAAFHKRPTYENWDVMSTFGTFDPNANPLLTTDTTSIKIVSSYIRRLGDALDMEYGPRNSYSSIYEAKKYAKNQMLYTDARIQKWNWERVRKRLGKGLPVYTQGSGPQGGHAWIVDGYINQRYDNTHFRTLVHVNWGWAGGYYDGYYAVGVFDPTTPPELVESAIGDKGKSRTDGVYFDKKIKTLTWSAQ